MSLFNRKGYRTLLGKNASGDLKAFPVKTDSKLALKHEHRINKARKERQQAFREYKKNLRKIKKRVPLAERATINWAKLPERYL